jgi:hypothetical protein
VTPPHESRSRPPGFPDEIYLDESLNRGGYDIIGGLWLTRPNVLRLRRVIHSVRNRFNYHREFKWTKATGATLSPAYKELAQLVGDQIRAGRARFNCIVLTTRLIDYRTYHEKDKELGFYKFMHLLVRKRVDAGRSYLLYVDHRTTRRDDRLSTLQRTVNRGARTDYGLAYDCCRDVQALDSKTSDILQVVDLLVGAVGRQYVPESSVAKNFLAARIAKAIGKDDLTFASPPWERNFNIWRWTPSEHTK